ncbi:hypothetical protein B5F35_15420 [Anaeromassilibacillus sp. An200]|nr:hypothetical protein B5F35_15420 [Anaeromassilibacillus sp. An200]
MRSSELVIGCTFRGGILFMCCNHQISLGNERAVSHVPQFDQLAGFSKPYAAILFSQIQDETLALALTGASSAVKERILQLVTPERVQTLQAMCSQFSGSANTKDIEMAQRTILQQRKQVLIERGWITPV